MSTGVPMVADSSATTVGPEDAFSPGTKRGDYSARIGSADYAPHVGDTAQRPYAQGTRVVDAVAVAAGADLVTSILTAAGAATLDTVTYAPAADMTGVATNNRKLSLINTGSAGNGTTEMAAVSFGNGTDAEEDVALTITLSSTPGNLTVAAGDQIVWKSLHTGSGIADPGGVVSVIFSVGA